MAEPNEKMSRTIIVLVIGAAITIVFGWVGDALKPAVFSADMWGSVASGFAWFAGEVSKFTSSLWFLIPFAALVGSWLGITSDRWLRSREKTTQRETTWVQFAEAPPPPSAPVVEDPLKVDLNRHKMLDEFRIMHSELGAIVNDRYSDDAQRFRLFKTKGAEIDSFYVTMKKAGHKMPQLYERSLFEYAGVYSLLKDLKPFLDARHWEEAIERGNDHASRLEELYLGRHEKAKVEREAKSSPETNGPR